jgi:CxxC-x17-CxxC domain-containing protein
MAYTDRELTCRDCGASFVFTAGEQEFYAGKGLQHDPSRCSGCRSTRKMMRPEEREETPNYGVYVSWGGRTPRQLHRAQCSSCGNVAEVPFVPRGDRPIFCSDCYNKERERQVAAEEAEMAAAGARLSAAAVERESRPSVADPDAV